MKLIRCISALAFTLAAGLSHAAFPEKAITLVVPFAAGGANNIIARIIAQELGTVLGQTIVVENKPGAGGAVGSEMVSRAAPDGYTLLIVSPSHAVNPSVKTKMPYDTLAAFSPVMQVTKESPYVMIVGESQPIKTVADAIALGKAKPGALTYASSGNGGAPHLSGAYFAHMAGIEMTHVPYKGGGPALVDVMRGDVTMYFSSLSTAGAQIKAGKVRAIAVTTTTRSFALPDVPTIAEAGLPGYNISGWYGILAPAKTPKAVIDVLNAALIKVMNTPSVRTALANQGEEPTTGTPEEFNRLIAAEIVNFAKIVKIAKVEPE